MMTRSVFPRWLATTIFNETFRKPFDTGLLAERVRTLISRKKQLA